MTKGTSKLQNDTDKWLGMGTPKEEKLGLVTKSESSGEDEGRWEILRNSFKPFPCGIVIHPIIDACARLHHKYFSIASSSEFGPKALQQIKSVTARVHPLVLELTGKRTPKDGLEAKFSVYHGGAIGLLFGKGTPDQYLDEVVLSSEVIEVRDKIQCIADTALTPDQCHIEMQIDTGSGGIKTLEIDVEHAVGSLEVPMTEDLLQEKFLGQTHEVLGSEKAKELSDLLWELESVKDIAEFTGGK